MKRVVAAVVLFLAGCAGDPQVHQVQDIYLCAADGCGSAAQGYSPRRILLALHELLQLNAGKEFKYCMSSPETRSCESEGIGHFVMGGPLPGYGSQSVGKFAAPRLDEAQQTIVLTKSAYSQFVGVPLVCADHDATFAVRSAYEITWTENDFYCNWVGVGNMSASFSLAVESIDFDKGRIGGYWSHAVVGTGVGRGTGYGIIQFSEAMPKGRNWLSQ